MAALWTKNPDGTWVKTTIYAGVGAASGANSWRYASKVYEKTGASTWTQRWTRDLTAPAAPVLTYTTNTTAKTSQISITIPNTPDITKMIIKVSRTVYPAVAAPVNETGVTFYDFITDDGTVWGMRDVVPGQVVVRNIGAMSANQQYYYTAWVQDVNGNWSVAGKLTYKFPAPPAVAPPPV